MIYTSYFEKMKAIRAADSSAVFCAVCGGLPELYDGSWYRKVAPKLSWWKWWHDTYAGHYESEEAKSYYTACYKNTVLDRLDRSTVMKEFKDIADGNNLYLLCFEEPDKFCHRHLLADWLNEETDNKIIEWKENDMNNKDMQYNYSIALRAGLSPEALFIKSYGFADTFEEAIDKAFKIIHDPANADDLLADSMYVRQIIFKKNECVGLDYGSHSRFIIVEKKAILHVVSIWRLDAEDAPKPTVVYLDKSSLNEINKNSQA